MAHDTFGLIGRIVDGALRIDRVAAAGGFSVVYRAFHLGLREHFAVKCLHVPAGLSSAGERVVMERFALEGRLQSKLAHRGIARTFGVGSTTSPADGRLVPFVLLEWLEGRSLADEIASRASKRLQTHSLSEVVELLDGAVDGLAYAHTLGAAHRDVKPRNLFVLSAPASPSYRTKLIDFGAAKLFDDRALHAGPAPSSVEGGTALSLPYAAPEQFEKAMGAIGPWTDVYSLALTVLETAAGHRVVQAEHYVDYGRIALDPVRRPTPRALGISCNEAVEEVFRKAVAVDPRDRWADAGIFWGAMKAALRESGVVEVRRPASTVVAYRLAQESKTRPGPYGASSSPRRAAVA
ncbi:MAG TPA: serine/threonine-protein kinase [Polyangiaceae bacterium]